MFIEISPDETTLSPPPVTVIVEPSKLILSISIEPNVPIFTSPVAVVTVDASSVFVKTGVPSILNAGSGLIAFVVRSTF